MSEIRTSLIVEAKDKASAELKAIADNIKQVSESAKTAGRGMREGSDGADKFLGSLKGIGMQILGAAGLTFSIAGLTSAAIGWTRGAAQMGMQMEQSMVAFKTMTGSVENAKKHLSDLRDFAATTPFQFNDLVESSKRLQAFGFDAQKVVPMLTDIGDAVAAMGGSSHQIDRVTLALGQMQAKGRVTGEELLQLTETGIPALRYLAENAGVTTGEMQKMISKGLVPASAGIDAILAGAKKDFGGMMAAQAQTASGKLSNLQDSLDAISTSIGLKMVPAINAGTDVLANLATTLKLVVTLQDNLNEAFAKQQTTIIKSSDGYEAYVEETVRSGLASNQFAAHLQTLARAADTHEERLQVLKLANKGVSEEIYNATRASEGWRDESDRAAAQAENLAAAMAASASATELDYDAKTKAAIAADLLSAALKGPLGDATAEVRVKMDELALAELAVVDSAGKTRTEKEKLVEALDKARDAAEGAREKMNALTNEYIFQQASAGLDAEASLELARAMGLVDEESYGVTKSVYDLKKAYDANKDGAIDAEEAARGYTSGVLGLKSAVDALHDKNITVTVTTIREEILRQIEEDTGYNAGVGSDNQGDPHRRQFGGPVWGTAGTPAFVYNESARSSPETLILGTSGAVLTRQQTQALDARMGGMAGEADMAMLATLRSLPMEIARAVRAEMARL